MIGELAIPKISINTRNGTKKNIFNFFIIDTWSGRDLSFFYRKNMGRMQSNLAAAIKNLILFHQCHDNEIILNNKLMK